MCTEDENKFQADIWVLHTKKKKRIRKKKLGCWETHCLIHASVQGVLSSYCKHHLQQKLVVKISWYNIDYNFIYLLKDPS